MFLSVAITITWIIYAQFLSGHWGYLAFERSWQKCQDWFGITSSILSVTGNNDTQYT